MNFVLDLRQRSVGGPVVPAVLRIAPSGPFGTPAEEMLALAERITFLIHGFNVSRDDGTQKLSNLATFLPESSNAALVAVLWPGDHKFGFWSYSFEGRDADDSAAELAKFVERVVPTRTSLSFVTHSLGARVALESATGLSRSGYAVKHVCLMAPAIDDFSLATDADYGAAVEAAIRVAVLSSTSDMVLKFAYPAGDLLQSFFFLRDEFGLALGYHGPKAKSGGPVPANVLHVAIPKARDSDHDHYLPEYTSTTQPKGKRQDNQKSAARFADRVISGDVSPDYN